MTHLVHWQQSSAITVHTYILQKQMPMSILSPFLLTFLERCLVNGLLKTFISLSGTHGLHQSYKTQFFPGDHEVPLRDSVVHQVMLYLIETATRGRQTCIYKSLTDQQKSLWAFQHRHVSHSLKPCRIFIQHVMLPCLCSPSTIR